MRIAIVNDVTLAVEAVRRVVLGTREHELAWVARDGAQAVELCTRDKPDLILMDLIMPRMDGVEATRRIMARTPCPIVVVTADVTDHSAKVFEAMGAGALDAVNTPALESAGAARGGQALLAKIDTIRRLVSFDEVRKPSRAAARQWLALVPPPDCLIALGASAGGPAALARVLARLPAEFSSPIVVVQHVDSQFAPGLAAWLDAQTLLEVRLAREGDHPQAGTVLLAGRDQHLVFASSTRLSYTSQPDDCSYRPSIDAFFNSAGRFWQGDIIAVLLTGMGRDGAEGLRSLRDHGHHTIAQDQASSAVYGMPKAAAELRAATEVLPLDKIAPRLNQLLAKKMKAHV